MVHAPLHGATTKYGSCPPATLYINLQCNTNLHCVSTAIVLLAFCTSPERDADCKVERLSGR
jgi:hypothetical protein